MSDARMGPTDGRHILIGGPGRSGTTLLVQYFTALGFDTGFSADAARSAVDPISRGGLEHSLGRTLGRGQRMPHVAKSPWFGEKLGGYLESGELEVECFIVAIRSLFDAAESRRLVSRTAEEQGLDPTNQPGGELQARKRMRTQEQRLAVRFYELVNTLARHDVPVVFLPFPDFARRHDVLYGRLGELLGRHGVTEEMSRSALTQVVDLDLIHEFSRP